MCRWGEAGWGEIVMKGKRRGKLDPRLVKAAEKLIRRRWKPDPVPAWVAYVPSVSHPKQVPDFAKKLAHKLGIPCIDVVKKLKSNSPQKKMENTHHRCRNLDGVFSVEGKLPDGPVLLVDDAVDSGWTFAVIGALLRLAGSGPVFPFAIVSTATRN